MDKGNPNHQTRDSLIQLHFFCCADDRYHASIPDMLKAYIKLARPDHWFKNIFVVPGILLVWHFRPEFLEYFSYASIAAGFAAVCIIASANYVLNEILDSEKDIFHPEKKNRPIPKGEVTHKAAYVEFALLSIVGLGLAATVSLRFGGAALCLWIMGLVYNVPPLRLKDRAYGDVLSESVNNPLRMAMGWYSTGCNDDPTLSVLLAYWMFGAFLMAAKRFAEYRHIGDPSSASKYRKSFGFYNEERLLESMMFYASLFGMFSGVFIARYRPELVLATPAVCYCLAYYLHLTFRPDSPVQHPERLYREKKLLVLTILSFAACTLLLFLDLPSFDEFFAPWGSTRVHKP